MTQQTPEIKVLFIGLDGAGKTSIITKLKELKDGELKEIYPTPFIECSHITYNNKIINCVEVSGLKRYRKVWKNFYNEVDGIIFEIDGTDVGRMKVVKELIQDLDKNLDKIIPVVFMVNKQDIIEKSLSVEQVKNFIELDRMATDFSWQIVKTISYKGIGLNEALDYIVTEVLTG
jgi:ADP-ribosylation factor-like protein 2